MKKESNKTIKKRTSNPIKKITDKIKKNPFLFTVLVLSILILIVGTIAYSFLKTFILVLVADIFAILVGNHKKGKKKMSVKDKIKAILLVCFTLGIFVLLAGISFCVYIVMKAPTFDPEELKNKEPTVIYAPDGTLMAKLGMEIREPVNYDQLADVFVDALIATEDSRFFQHNGVDLPRFLKASVSQVLGHGGGGASTLTMQLSKNKYTSNEDSGIEGIIRKFTDIYLAVFKIEKTYTKEQIIEFYVNYSYMGHGNYGVEQASKDYFGKSVKDVNLAEAAVLAGLFQAPVGYDPYINPEACEDRRQEVLYLMLRHNYITQEEYDIAIQLTVDKLLVPKTNTTSKYRDFVDTVAQEVINRTGNNPYEVPMRIYATMDTKQQENMDNIMNGNNKDYWINDKIQAGAIVINVKNGEIVAVGAGRNIPGVLGDNYATKIKRQMGSTAKPLYDYGPGIEYNNWSTYTNFIDEPYSYSDGTSIGNWDGTYLGSLSLHNSLKLSRNITALKAFQQTKSKDKLTFVKSLGLSPEDYLHETHAIGGYAGESPLTVAAAYAAFSNGGYYIEPHSFTKLIYIETGEEYTVKPITRKAMSEETAYMITKVLEEASGYVTNHMSINGVNYCAKTGTTDFDSATRDYYDYPRNAIRDRWLASFNDTYSIALWYGYVLNEKDYYMTTSTLGQRWLLRDIAKAAYTKKSTWTKPDGVVEVEVEIAIPENERRDEYISFPEAKLASKYTPDDLKVTAYFKKGLEPTEESTRFQQLKDVTNLAYDENTGTLSWTLIETPDYLTREYFENLYAGIKDNEVKNQNIEEILDYNEENIGKIAYNIYAKSSTGDYQLIGTTHENSFNYKIIDSTTFKVVTTYTIFKDNASSGAELNFEYTIQDSIITSELTGDEIVTLTVGDPYIETQRPINVLEDLVDVTADSTIIKTITRLSDNAVVERIDTSVPETFNITYEISYKNYTNTLTRVVEIKETIE